MCIRTVSEPGEASLVKVGLFPLILIYFWYVQAATNKLLTLAQGMKPSWHLCFIKILQNGLLALALCGHNPKSMLFKVVASMFHDGLWEGEDERQPSKSQGKSQKVETALGQVS